MPLTYDLTSVKNRDRSEDGFIITKAVVFHSLGVRIWHITEENASEWYARIHFLERNLGETLVLRGKDDPTREGNEHGYWLTPEDIRKHIGAQTNQGEDLGRKEWIRNVVARYNPHAESHGLKKYTYAEVRGMLAQYADEYLEYVETH